MFGVDFRRALLGKGLERLGANPLRFVNTTSRLTALTLAAALGGCAIADFTPYSGASTKLAGQ